MKQADAKESPEAAGPMNLGGLEWVIDVEAGIQEIDSEENAAAA